MGRIGRKGWELHPLGDISRGIVIAILPNHSDDTCIDFDSTSAGVWVLPRSLWYSGEYSVMSNCQCMYVTFTLVWISATPDKEPTVCCGLCFSKRHAIVEVFKHVLLRECYNSKTLIILILVLKLILICIFLLMYFWEIALLVTILILITSYLSEHHEKCRSWTLSEVIWILCSSSFMRVILHENILEIRQ